MTRLTLDPLLVWISLLFAFSAAWLAVAFSARVRASGVPSWRAGWMLLGSLTMGMGLWAMHYMGQLSYHSPVRVYCYEPMLLLSVVASMLVAWLAMYLLSRRTSSGLWATAGSLLVGAGIAAMHTMGDASLRFPAVRLLPVPAAMLSVVVEMVLCVLAVHVLSMAQTVQTLRMDQRKWTGRKIVGTLLLGAAAPCMHYLDMASTRIISLPVRVMPVYAHSMNIESVAMLCIGVGIVMALSLALLLGAVQQDALRGEEQVAAQRLRQEELDRFHRRLVQAFRGAGVGVWYFDPKTNMFHADQRLKEFYGTAHLPEPVPANAWRQCIHPEDLAESDRSWMAALKTGSVFEYEYRLIKADSEPRFARTVASIERNEAGEVIQVSGMTWDVTDEWQQKRAMRNQEERFLRTLEGIADAVIAVDEQHCVLYVNPAAAALMAVGRPDWQGKSIMEIFFAEDELTGERCGNPIDRCLAQGGRLLTEDGVLVSRSGERYNIRKRMAMLEGGGAVITFQDITAERAAAKALEHAATHDAMTGLANRQRFEKLFAQVWMEERQAGRVHCLCVLDLDRFKIVNDTLGHPAGDALLKQVVRLLETHMEQGNLLARMGGDEFLLLLRDTDADHARAWAQHLLTSLAAMRFAWEGKRYSFTASLGIVPFDAASRSRETLISEADMAMLSAKRNGRNQVAVYQQGGIMLQELEALLSITAALEEDRFELHAQPIVPVHSTTERVYFELLIRMRDATGAMVYPAMFLPTAERQGMMSRIDRWVIRHALEVYSRHPKLGQLRFAINLSGQSLSDAELWPFVAEQFRSTGVPPQTITFEVTETGMIENMDVASAFLQKARALGCRVALDDFGTGMSSLSYLKQFALDYVKIDGSFVRHLRHSELDQSIVRATAKIAHTMYAVTVGECLEDMAMLELLEELGVGMVQGNAIGRPRLLQEVLKEHAGEPASA